MRRKALTFRGTLKPSKAQSSPIFMDVKRIDIFHNQKTSLESLSNLIKYHQVNFFSISLEKNESDNIIETLLSLKNSLINSLNNQTQQRNDLLKKVKKNYYFIF
jgi:flagellar biosynthesis/type III secretory pathway chaperone